MARVAPTLRTAAGGGVASALRWFGGGFQNNGGAGLTLDNGTRDMDVEGASFVSNNGPGISALWGITAVSASNFVDNHGIGANFENYGNFNNNTFSTSGSQTVGISAYLVNEGTLVGNASTYTGAGPDPTVLANMRGPGGLFVAGDSGPIVTEPSVVKGGILANVVVGTQGVAVPTLAPVTAATTAPAANSTGTGALETALKTAIASGTVAHLTAATYTVTKSIVINVTASTQGPVGIDLGGAKIISQITDGSPVIEIIVGPGVKLGSLTLSNFMLEGTQQEGDGIKIVADGADRSVHGLNISNVELEHVGGIGLDVLGNVQGTVFNSWMNANSQGGARFANSAHGGVASGLEWIGGGFRQNGVAGLILDNGAQDMIVKGAYFVDNHGPGIDATSGITLVQGSGFENNQGAGAIVQGSANFSDDTFSTYGPQLTGIGGYLAGGQVTAIGDLAEYYGSGSPQFLLANVQGQGSLAISSFGTVVAGPTVDVTDASGAPPTVIEAFGSTSLVQVANTYFLYPVGGSSGPQLRYNGAPVTAGLFGSWTPIGAEQIAAAMRLPGRSRGPISTRCGTPTAAAISSRTPSVWCLEASVALEIARTQFPPGPQWRRDDRSSHDGDRGVWIDQPGSGRERLFSVSGRWVVGSPAALWRRVCRGGSIWLLDADRRGADAPAAMRLPGRSRGADQYTVWNTDSSGNYLSQHRRGVWNQRCAGIARTQFPPGPQHRRDDRSSHDGDRGVWIDQPGSGREHLFSVSGRRVVGSPAALWRRVRRGGSIWLVDADRRGADRKRRL